MTNAEKYIGDEDMIDEFIDEFAEFATKQDWVLEYHCLKERLVEFFKKEVTPTLTEDERVILRNIDKSFYTIIFRQECLFITGKHTSPLVFTQYDHLFQFIKERRRI